MKNLFLLSGIIAGTVLTVLAAFGVTHADRIEYPVLWGLTTLSVVREWRLKNGKD